MADQVANQVPFVQFTANGVTTVFGYAFEVPAAADMKVYADGVLVPESAYTLAGVGVQSGGSVTFLVAPVNGTRVLLNREIALQRTTGYQTLGDFRADVVNPDFNRLWMALQQFNAVQGGAVRVPYPGQVNELPYPAGFSGYYIGIDGAGQPTYLLAPSGTAGALAGDLANTSNVALGDAMVGVKKTAPGAAALTLHNWIEGQAFNVKSDFCAVGDNTADDTAEIQAAIDAASLSNGGYVFLPPGTYKTTSTLIVSGHRVHLVGAGSWATRIRFAPTANDTCMHLQLGSANVLFQGSVRGLCFYSDDSTWTKTAIEIVDTSSYLLDDIVVGGSILIGSTVFWSGSNSIGIRYRGREACKSSRLFIAADRPIVISENPNSSIDIDHFHFADLYLLANGNPSVEIDTGVNLTSTTFDGYQAWVLGTDGLRWIDTTSSGGGNSQNLTLRGVRTEQGSSATAWSVRIEHNQTLQGLTIDQCQFDATREGVKLRKVKYASLKNSLIGQGAGRIALDVNSTVQGIDIEEIQWVDNGTANMTGQVLVRGTPNEASAAPLPPNGRYQSTSISDQRTTTDMANGGYILTVENGAVAALRFGSAANQVIGKLTVVDSEFLSATFDMRGTSQTVVEAEDTAGVYSHTAGTATSTNVYWSAGNARYEIQNNRGTQRRYLITLTGSYSTF
jgi:hypothetical protein